jgi:hypothetical protein
MDEFRKRSQVTLYLIISLILIVALLLILSKLITKSESKSLVRNNAENSDDYNLLVDDCLRKTTYAGIMFIGYQGGSYHLSKNSENYYIYGIEYRIRNNMTYPFRIYNIQVELDSYVTNNLQKCRNLENITPKYEFNLSAAKIRTEITDTEITIAAEIPIKSNIRSISKLKGEYYTTLELPITRYYEAANGLLDILLVAGNLTPLSAIGHHSTENYYRYNIVYLNDNRTVYKLLFYDPGSNLTSYYIQFIVDSK